MIKEHHNEVDHEDWSEEPEEHEECFKHYRGHRRWHFHKHHKHFPVRGPLHLLILKLLSEKPLHGSEIREALKTKIEIEVPSSAIYAILSTLEEKGLVLSKWETSERGAARKLYSITEYGIEYLKEKIDELKRFKKIFEFLTS